MKKKNRKRKVAPILEKEFSYTDYVSKNNLLHVTEDGRIAMSGLSSATISPVTANQLTESPLLKFDSIVPTTNSIPSAGISLSESLIAPEQQISNFLTISPLSILADRNNLAPNALDPHWTQSYVPTKSATEIEAEERKATNEKIEKKLEETAQGLEDMKDRLAKEEVYRFDPKQLLRDSPLESSYIKALETR